MSTATLPADPLLSPNEAAEILGVKPQTLGVWRMTGRHNLPFIRVGGKIRYRASDLADWLESNTIRPAAE